MRPCCVHLLVMRHVLLWTSDSKTDLSAELNSVLTGLETSVHSAGLLEVRPGSISAWPVPLPQLAFARQLLPFARPVAAESINSWAALLVEAIRDEVPEGGPWMLHVEPHYGERKAPRIGARAWHRMRKYSAPPPSIEKAAGQVDPAAGRRRCQFIRGACIKSLRQNCRGRLKHLKEEPGTFAEADSIAQLVLTTPTEGFLSIATCPFPFKNRHLLSPYPLGEISLAADPGAPSRAFAKLVEAERRLGGAIGPGQRCVDLGAAPGSWTYVAVHRGASVIAVDRSPLRRDLMESNAVRFVSSDAFTFRPSQPVDWLLCDVIAEPKRSAGLLVEWLENAWCKRFVVTLKFKGSPDFSVLAGLRERMPGLCSEWQMKRLCANKNEVCVFGVAERD